MPTLREMQLAANEQAAAAAKAAAAKKVVKPTKKLGGVKQKVVTKVGARKKHG